jgi:hypothetical protein
MRKLKALLFSIVLAGYGCSASQPAYAQGGPPCRPVEDGLAHLAKQFGETVVFKGTSEQGVQLLITASPAGTYSVLMLMPDGNACMVDSGQGVAVTPVKAPGRDS